MLSTIAGSMITVVGVTFSMVLVTLALASSQYSSRILRNCMRDRVTQVVLGIFAGVFTYRLIVLRTMRGADAAGSIPSLAAPSSRRTIGSGLRAAWRMCAKRSAARLEEQGPNRLREAHQRPMWRLRAARQRHQIQSV